MISQPDTQCCSNRVLKLCEMVLDPNFSSPEQEHNSSQVNGNMASGSFCLMLWRCVYWYDAVPMRTRVRESRLAGQRIARVRGLPAPRRGLRQLNLNLCNPSQALTEESLQDLYGKLPETLESLQVNARRNCGLVVAVEGEGQALRDSAEAPTCGVLPKALPPELQKLSLDFGYCRLTDAGFEALAMRVSVPRLCAVRESEAT